MRRFLPILVLSVLVPWAADAAPIAQGACCTGQGGPSELRGVDPSICCPPTGGCEVMTPQVCNLWTYLGDGTTCPVCPTTTTTTLPQTGACCAPDGSCSEGSEGDCEVGEFQGYDTYCAFVECPTTTTTTTILQTTTTLAPTTTLGPTTTLAPTTTTLPSEPVCGDANGDEDVSAADALIALKTAVGTAVCPLARCDYNGDGETTASDALAILRAAVGLPSSPDCP
jgi:hypothetical protein